MGINGEHVGSAEEGSRCSVQKDLKTQVIRNLGLQVEDIQLRLDELGNQGIIALRNQLDYGILDEEEFHDFTLGRMRDSFNRIIY